MKKIKVSTVKQMADVEVLFINSNLISKAIRASILFVPHSLPNFTIHSLLIKVAILEKKRYCRKWWIGK